MLDFLHFSLKWLSIRFSLFFLYGRLMRSKWVNSSRILRISNPMFSCIYPSIQRAFSKVSRCHPVIYVRMKHDLPSRRETQLGQFSSSSSFFERESVQFLLFTSWRWIAVGIRSMQIKGLFGFNGLKFNSHHINIPSNAWSTKCRLIACMSTQIRSNLRDKSIKPN
jgi:hypothetical protein